MLCCACRCVVRTHVCAPVRVRVRAHSRTGMRVRRHGVCVSGNPALPPTATAAARVPASRAERPCRWRGYGSAQHSRTSIVGAADGGGSGCARACCVVVAAGLAAAQRCELGIARPARWLGLGPGRLAGAHGAPGIVLGVAQLQSLWWCARVVMGVVWLLPGNTQRAAPAHMSGGDLRPGAMCRSQCIARPRDTHADTSPAARQVRVRCELGSGCVAPPTGDSCASAGTAFSVRRACGA